MATFRTDQDLLRAMGVPTGWTVVGRTPKKIKEQVKGTGAQAGTMVEVEKDSPDLSVWTVSDGKGGQGTIEVKTVRSGGEGVDAVVEYEPQGVLVRAPTPPKPDEPKPPATPSSGLDRLDAQGRLIPPGDTTTPAAKLRDPQTGATIDLPDPKTVPPSGTIREHNGDLISIDPTGTKITVIRPKDAPKGQKVIINGEDGGKYEYDEATGETRKLDTGVKPTTPGQPIGASQLQTRDNGDGTETPGVYAPDEKGNPVWRPALNADGTEVKRPKGSGATASPADITWIYDPTTGQEKASRLLPDGTFVDTGQTRPATGTILTPNTTAPVIGRVMPDGTIKWQKNDAQITVDQATADLMEQVGLKVKAGSMSMADAKDLLSGAVNVMNAKTDQQQADTALQESVRGAAANVLDYTKQNATTGANMLNQRVSSAQGMLDSILGKVGGLAQGSAGRFGTLGGGLTGASDLSGIGAGLTEGIAGYTAQLMGGQQTLDTAARLVGAVDPSGGSPQSQAAMGVLNQMLNKYRELSGNDHPAVAATTAANATVGSGAVTSPVTNAVTNPTAGVPNSLTNTTTTTTDGGTRPFMSPDWNRGDQDFGRTPAGAGMAAAGLAGTVGPDDPRRLGPRAQPNITINVA